MSVARLASLLIDGYDNAVYSSKVLFADKVGKREERIKNLPTEKLIEEFGDKKSGNLALIRKEMRERYSAGKDKTMIATAFNNATKSDQKWMKSQVRKER